MKFCVKDLLEWEKLNGVKVLGGREGLDNEITGVTIIEAPDIVRFINGGEVLLTGLYAFKSCSLEEFQNCIHELKKKKIGALMLKRGRNVELAAQKIAYLQEFAKECCVPVLEMPFEVSFKDIMSQIMERLFNEEVKRLKYFKTTHDNFEAIALSRTSGEDGMEKILSVLDKLIGNPTAVYNENMICLGTTDLTLCEMKFEKEAQIFEPEIASNYQYFVQKVKVEGGDEEVNQYLIHLNQVFGMKAYLVVTEKNNPLDVMDYITIEGAIAALQYEFSRKYALMELERKYQNDIMHNILSGKVRSPEELRKSTSLLGLTIDGKYKVIVLGMEYREGDEPQNINKKLKHMNMLNDAAQRYFPEASIHKDLDRIVVVQQEDMGEKWEKERKNVEYLVGKMQEYIISLRQTFVIKAGVGKMIEGISNLKLSYREANDALNFIDIAGEISGQEDSRVMVFSDMGILKLLCQIKNAEELREYIPESLQKLYCYKKGQRDDLIITLRTYLDRSQNLTKTAQDLYIHYKTAAYRMEKIADITGIDFENPGEVLAVRIGLVAYKILEKFE